MATIGTILSAVVLGAAITVATVGTVLFPGSEPYTGTLGTILSAIAIGGALTVATVGTVLFPGSEPYTGTLGTLMSGAVSVVNAPTVSVGSITSVLYQGISATATIKSTPGNLWGYEMNDQVAGLIGTASATLILFNLGAASAAGTVIGYIQPQPKSWAGIAFPRPRPYATLFASIIGTGVAIITYE